MRRLFLVGVMCVVSWVVPKYGLADSIPVPWHASLEAAFPAADQQKKLVVLAFVAEWCGYCRTLQNDVFPTQTLQSTWERHAIPVRIDIQEHPGISARFGVRSVPAVFLLTPDGKVLTRILGLRSAEAYRDAFVSASRAHQQYQQVAQRAESGEVESVLLLAELEIRDFQWSADGLRRLVALEQTHLSDSQHLRLEMLTLLARLQSGEWDEAEQAIDRIMAAFTQEQLGSVTTELEGMRSFIDQARDRSVDPQG